MFFKQAFGKQTALVAACAALALGVTGCGGSKAERAQSPPPTSLSEPIRVEEKKPVTPASVVPADEYAAVTPLPTVTVDSSKAEARPASIASGEGRQTYTMQKGDTLYGIARKFNVPVKQLVAANNFKDPNKLPVGTKVLIP